MTLITEMMQRPLDPSYAAEARRREAAGLPRRSGTGWRLGVVAFLVGLLLVTAAQNLRQPREAVAGQRAALVQQIRDRQGHADELARRRVSLQAEIARSQAGALADADRADLTSRLATEAAAAGTAAVTGPGLVVTLDDAKRAAGAVTNDDPRASEAVDAGKVVARDLQLVVNGLWQAGAEAISVNGQRLTSTSAIRFAGDAILVDYRPLARPYVVSVVGDGPAIEKAFTAGVDGQFVQALSDETGVRYERRQEKSLTLPGGSAPAPRTPTRSSTPPAGAPTLSRTETAK